MSNLLQHMHQSSFGIDGQCIMNIYDMLANMQMSQYMHAQVIATASGSTKWSVQ